MPRGRPPVVVGLVLLLSFVSLTLALRHPPTFAAAREPDLRRFLRGFTWEEAPGSLTDARIVLHGAAGVVGTLMLTVEKTPWAQGSGDRVWIQRGDEPPVQGRFRPRERRLFLDVPALSAVGPWQEVEPLELRVEARSAVPGYGEVGIRVADLAFEPRGPRRLSEALAGAAHLTWFLGILGLLLLEGERRFRGSLPRLAFALPLCAAAVGLVYLAWRHPYALSWWLPPMPVTLGVLTLVLAVRGLGRVFRRMAFWTALGFLLVAVAQILFGLGAIGPVAVVAAVLGVVLLLDRDAEIKVPEPSRAVATSALIGIVLVAGALRFARIEELPSALWRDEARHGLVAAHILEDPSYRPVYVAQRTPAKINLPAFGLYLMAAGVKAFGLEPWSMRPATALGGLLTLLPFYGLARLLFASRTTALLATAILATTLSHVALSRHQFPTVFDPLFTLTGLWLIAAGAASGASGAGAASAAAAAKAQKGEWWGLAAMLLAGLSLGLAVQTYHSARVAPIVGALAAWLLFRGKPGARPAWTSLAVGFFLVMLPLVVWAARHPAAFNDRMSEVALLPAAADRGEPPLAALDRSLLGHLGMFNAIGDRNGLHNLPGRPLFDVFVGFGFLGGAALLLRRLRHPPSVLLLSALVLGVLPSLLAVDGPHNMRAIGVIAPACLVAALGWARVAGWAFGASGRVKTASLGGAVVAIAAGLTARAYFVEMPKDPRVLAPMSSTATEIGRAARRIGREQPLSVYVPASLAFEDAFQYLTHGTTVRTFRGAALGAPPATGDVFLLPGPEPGEGFLKLEPVLAPGVWRLGPALPGGETSFVAYRAR